MFDRKEFFVWLREYGLPYEPADVADFVPDAELILVDLRRTLDPHTSLFAQACVIRIGRIREDGMVYYRYHPEGREECFVPMRNLLVHETSVALKIRKSAEVVHLRAAS